MPALYYFARLSLDMRTQVEFRSNLFPPYPGEDDEIIPGRWGKRLAEFVHSGLKNRGFDVIEPGAEDWGWMVESAKMRGSRYGSPAEISTVKTTDSSASSNRANHSLGNFSSRRRSSRIHPVIGTSDQRDSLVFTRRV